MIGIIGLLIFKAPSPQNGQTQIICRLDELFECDHFVGLALKQLKSNLAFYKYCSIK